MNNNKVEIILPKDSCGKINHNFKEYFVTEISNKSKSLDESKKRAVINTSLAGLFTLLSFVSIKDGINYNDSFNSYYILGILSGTAGVSFTINSIPIIKELKDRLHEYRDMIYNLNDIGVDVKVNDKVISYRK